MDAIPPRLIRRSLRLRVVVPFRVHRLAMSACLLASPGRSFALAISSLKPSASLRSCENCGRRAKWPGKVCCLEHIEGYVPSLDSRDPQRILTAVQKACRCDCRIVLGYRFGLSRDHRVGRGLPGIVRCSVRRLQKQEFLWWFYDPEFAPRHNRSLAQSAGSA